MRKLRYLWEYLMVLGFYNLFGSINMDRASAFGGFVGRIIGRWMKVNATARRNMERAMPELRPEQIDEIMDKMWDNIGRFVGEFPHIEQLRGENFLKRIELVGAENLEKMRAMGRGGILFCGHFANWELIPQMAQVLGVPIAIVYRKANNPMVNNFIIRARKDWYKSMYNKGTEAARGVVSELKKKGYAGMVVDQKMNEGIKLKLFGRDAMTAPALAQFAITFGCPALPVRVIRKKGAYFRMEILPPIEITDTGNKEEDVKVTMQRVNDIFESWIREYPEQWFWLHKRWME